jgi:hypothetical protein
VFIIKSDNTVVTPGEVADLRVVNPVVINPPGSDPTYDPNMPDYVADYMITYLKQLPARNYRIPNYISDWSTLPFDRLCPAGVVQRSGCWSFVDYDRGGFLFGLAGPESGWYRKAYNSSACNGPCHGLYQFAQSTWINNNNARLGRSNSSLSDPDWRNPYAQMDTVKYMVENGDRKVYLQNWTADMINYSSNTSKWWINNVDLYYR